MDEDEAVCTSHESPRPRKHRRESTVNGYPGNVASSQGPAAKRPRCSNGSAATSNGHHAKSSDSMDIDFHSASHTDSTSKRDLPAATAHSPLMIRTGLANQNGSLASASVEAVDASEVDAHADDDALQAQPKPNHATLVPTLTNGCSVGVQIDKVAELGPETTVLTVPDKNVTHAAWNPRDPAFLATGGDTLCRIWTISGFRSASTENPNPFTDLLASSEPATVTSMAWSPDGESLAIATHGKSPESQGSVTIRTKAGAIQDELPGGHDWVLNLAWNPSGSLLLGITHSDDVDSTLIVWDVQRGQSMQPFELENAVMDATWVDDRKFLLCGQSLIAESIIENQCIDALQSRSEPDVHHGWTKIRYDSLTRTTAIVAEDSGTLVLIDASADLHIIKAHDVEITGLMYQPLSNPSSLSDSSPRLLATSSSDGTIKIWDARRHLTLINTLSLGRSSPALAVSFTPDGYLVAAASWNKVLIWSAEIGGMPKASWNGKDELWQVGAVQPASDEEVDDMVDHLPIHSLSWDADGGKLAYGLRNQVNFIFEPRSPHYRCTNDNVRLPLSTFDDNI